ncbi:MAG: antitoxin [Solobacterium sp.]|nr:antitoxin [Solobacterium sp.]
MSTTVTIRLNDEEKAVFDEYASIYKGGLSTMIKQLALEKIQDEYDLAAARKFEEGIKDGSVTIRPYEELLKETGIK